MKKCFSGYYDNSDELLKSASGGLAYVIALNCIRKGGIAYGVAYKEDFTGASWIRCTCEDELDEIRGTKYVKADAKIKGSNILVYDSVINDIIEGREVTFFGLPCEVGVLIQKVKKHNLNTRLLLTIDLICQGPATPRLFNEFLDLKRKEFNSQPISINMRFKQPDWKHPHFRIIFKNGKEYCVPLQQTEFWSACVNMPMPSCTQCHFKGENHVSDITIGDHWGLSGQESFYNANGTSVALVHTENGLKLIDELENFTMVECKWDDVVAANPRYEFSVTNDEKKKRYKKMYETYGLQYAHLHRESTLDKLKKQIKKMWRQ